VIWVFTMLQPSVKVGGVPFGSSVVVVWLRNGYVSDSPGAEEVE